MSLGDPPPDPYRDPTQCRFARAAHTAWRRIGDETVILDQVGHRLFGLNESAGAVWHLLDSARSAEELSAASGVSLDEVAAFLGRLAQSGLVEDADGASAEGAAEPPAPVELADSSPPVITWHEPLQHAAQTAACAFLPAQNPLCNSAPFS